MEPYSKIQSLFKRDGRKLTKEYSRPEFEYLKDNTWIFTEKVDGTNIRIMSLSSGEVVFADRTNNANIPAKLLEWLIKKFPPHSHLAKQFPDGGCLYGEGYGAGIQKGGGNYIETQEFVLFDVKVGKWWLEQKNIEDVAVKLGISIVPIVGEGNLDTMISYVKDDFASFWGHFVAEGIVARPKVTLLQRDGERIITKLKCKDFK